MPVQNPILHFKGPSYGCYLYVSVSIPQAYREITLDIGLKIFPSLVSISEEKEWVTKNPPKAPKLRGHPNTCVMQFLKNQDQNIYLTLQKVSSHDFTIPHLAPYYLALAL